MIANQDELRAAVARAVAATPVTDIHTHLFPPDFGDLLLWGLDELLTYHYLVAETFHWVRLPYSDFWHLPGRARADLVWRTLFVERSPLSEACRGILTVLHALGLDVRARDLEAYREYFARQDVSCHLDRVLAVANVSSLVMTNDPFIPAEHCVWMEGFRRDRRFHPALRIDSLLNDWEDACRALRGWDYQVETGLSPASQAEVRRFLTDWIDRMGPIYLAVSLPPDFTWPEDAVRARLLDQCVLPVTAARGLPLAMMIGVRKLVNKGLGLAGDAVGRAAVEPVERLCAAFPGNKFMLTMLARENQHECCVAARKFGNLLLFGCWWFMNNPSLVEETTRMRAELLGLGFVPQHSDARVLEQLIYKWAHAREIITRVLADKYIDLMRTGWAPTEEEIGRDVAGLLGGNFREFLRV